MKTASDGNEGLGLIESEAFDVVVLDVKMPGMSGMQVLKAIKGRFPDIEVILLSGHADMDDAVDSLAFGAFDFLVKPPAPNGCCAGYWTQPRLSASGRTGQTAARSMWTNRLPGAALPCN